MKCDLCNKEMTKAQSCTANSKVTFADGSSLTGIRYRSTRRGGRCYNCGIRSGGFHHLGCDMERCPSCGGQRITCNCTNAENPIDAEVLEMEQTVTQYVFQFYMTPGGLCSLCGNSGIVNTLSTAITPNGAHVGSKQPCLCPNGQAVRRLGNTLRRREHE